MMEAILLRARMKEEKEMVANMRVVHSNCTPQTLYNLS